MLKNATTKDNKNNTSLPQTDFELEYTEEGAKRTLPQSISKNSMSKERDIALHDAPPTPEARLTPVNSEVRRTSVASFCSGEDDEEEYRGLDLLVEVAEEHGQDRNSRLKEHLRSTLSPRTKELETDFLPMIADIESMLQGGDITENDLQVCAPCSLSGLSCFVTRSKKTCFRPRHRRWSSRSASLRKAGCTI